MFDFIKSWYYKGLPHYTQIKPYIANSVEILHAISGNHKAQLRFEQFPGIAYAEIDHSTIVLSVNVFAELEKDVRGYISEQDLSYALVGVTNGLVVHEALHLGLTEMDIDDAVTYYHHKYEPPITRLLAACYNIVEDIYIEERLRANPEISFYWGFLKTVYEFYLSTDDFTTHVENELYLDQLDSFSVFWKNLECRATFYDIAKEQPLVEELIKLFEPLQGELTQTDRVDIGYELYLLCLKHDKDNKNRKLYDFENCESSDAFIGSSSHYPNDEYGQTPVTHANTVLGQDGERFARELTVKAKRFVDNQKFGGVVVHHISEYSRYDFTPLFLPDVAKFALSIVDRDNIESKPSSILQASGRLSPRGLTRSRFTPNIFGDRSEKSKRWKVPTIILLIDLSGSMCALSDSVSSRCRWQVVADFAYTFAKELGRNQSRFFVYGHTTYNYSGIENCLIVPIADNRSFGVSNFESVFGIGKANNSDHLAIEYVVKKHRNEDNPMLFVLSDGAPSSRAYISRKHGIEQTQTIVNQSRKTMRVFSISIDPDVISDNDKIYGKENNFDGTSVEKMLEAFTKAVF